MTNNVELIENLRKALLRKKVAVSKLEMTSGNYDEKGRLITKPIPTITTELCEIGSYGNMVYFVCVISSNSFNSTLFRILKTYANAKVYGFINFKATLYPAPRFSYIKLKSVIEKEKYFQVQFEYCDDLTAQELYEQYLKIKNDLLACRLTIVNQLKVNITCLAVFYGSIFFPICAIALTYLIA